MSGKKFILASIACAALSASGFAATIDLTPLLNDAQFQGGNQTLNGCPVGWNCGGTSTTSYSPTAAQYNPATDGIGKVSPNGAVATMPFPVEGSGSIQQAIAGQTYAAGNTYTFSFWLGTPATLPSDNTTPAGAVQTVTFYFTDGTGAVQEQAISLTAPAPGQWQMFTESFTPSTQNVSAIGSSIGIKLFEGSATGGSGNNLILDFDPAAPTPEPATMALIGAGLAGLALLRKRAA